MPKVISDKALIPWRTASLMAASIMVWALMTLVAKVFLSGSSRTRGTATKCGPAVPVSPAKHDTHGHHGVRSRDLTARRVLGAPKGAAFLWSPASAMTESPVLLR
jgi:hypothetical protein